MTTSNDDRIEAVRTALANVMDPELAINVVDLGMITEIEHDNGRTLVSMVLTTMTCPFWELFVSQVQDAVGDVPGAGEVVVRHDSSRRWTPELMTDEARWELEITGLLPTSTWLTATG